MGGDHGPPVVIPAVARAITSLPDTVRFLLHGDETILDAELAKHRGVMARVEVRHSDRVVGMDEKPAQALTAVVVCIAPPGRYRLAESGGTRRRTKAPP